MHRTLLLLAGAVTLAACGGGKPGAAAPKGDTDARLCTLGDPDDCNTQCNARNNSGACMELGAMFEAGITVGVDLKKATALYAHACEMGNGFGCSSAGYMFGTGKGTPIDYPKSIALYERACELGVGQGCYNLGVMFESGYGVARNERTAVLHFEYACLIGSAAGCSSAGVKYIMGRGVVRNVERGLSYLKQGCAGGNKWGCERLQEIAAAQGGAPPGPGGGSNGAKGPGESM